MKKLMIMALAVLISMVAVAGNTNVTRSGKTFKVERVSQSAPKQEIATGYYWEGKDGNYPIYMGAKGGCYYYKVAKSGKNAGQPVKRYIPREQAEVIRKELGK